MVLLTLSLCLLTGCAADRPATGSDPTPTAVTAPVTPALVLTNTVQPVLFFVTPPPVRTEEPLSPDGRNIPSVFEGIVEYHPVPATLTSVDQPPLPASDPATAARSVVQIRRCDSFGCETPAGSGVIIHPSGLILTAYHVLLTDPEDPNAARYPDFVIAMTENPRSAPHPRYRARLVASKADQDLALLTIDRTLDTAPLVDNALALPALPLADVTTLFGNDLLVLGYPVTGGEAISYTPVGFRSFDDDGRLIVVDQALDPGNSGGPALLLRDGRFTIAGLVIRRRSTQGQLSQQGLLRTIDQLHTLTWTPSVPRAWGEHVQAQTQTTDAAASLQLALTLNTVDLVGQPLRLLFYATNAATDQPWRSVGMKGPLVVWADVEAPQVIARQRLTLTVPVESLGVLPDRLRFRALFWEMKEGNALWAYTAGVQSHQRAVALAPTATPTVMPTATETETNTPEPTMTNTSLLPTPTFTDTPTPEPTATATLEPALTPTPTATMTDTAIMTDTAAMTATTSHETETTETSVSSVTVSDQESDGTTVTVDQVVAAEPGWVVIHANDDGRPGAVLGQTSVVLGTTENVVVALNEPIIGATNLWAMLNIDAGTVGEYEFPGADGPVIMDGMVIMAPFTAIPVLPPPHIRVNANLRSGPGTNFPVTGGTVTGQAIRIVARNEDASWFQLDNGGWVAAFLVVNAPNADDVPFFQAKSYVDSGNTYNYWANGQGLYLASCRWLCTDPSNVSINSGLMSRGV